MINSGSVFGQIGESFETLGQDVARETVQAPKDIVGKALETVGISAGGKKKKKQAITSKALETPEEAKSQQELEKHDEEIKRAIARRALEELSGVRPKQKEPTVWERLQKEEEEKKEMEKKKKEAQKNATLPQMSSKRKRGDLYGVKARKTSTENRNVRQD